LIFISAFLVLSQYVAWNVVVAVMLQKFSCMYSLEPNDITNDELFLTAGDLREFAAAWDKCDLTAHGWIPARREMLRMLVLRLDTQRWFRCSPHDLSARWFDSLLEVLTQLTVHEGELYVLEVFNALLVRHYFAVAFTSEDREGNILDSTPTEPKLKEYWLKHIRLTHLEHLGLSVGMTDEMMASLHEVITGPDGPTTQQMFGAVEQAVAPQGGADALQKVAEVAEAMKDREKAAKKKNKEHRVVIGSGAMLGGSIGRHSQGFAKTSPMTSLAKPAKEEAKPEDNLEELKDMVDIARQNEDKEDTSPRHGGAMSPRHGSASIQYTGPSSQEIAQVLRAQAEAATAARLKDAGVSFDEIQVAQRGATKEVLQAAALSQDRLVEFKTQVKAEVVGALKARLAVMMQQGRAWPAAPSKLPPRVIYAVYKHLSERDRNTLEDLYKHMDINHDGRVTWKEMRMVVQHRVPHEDPVTQASIRSLCTKMDADHDNKISEGEWLSFFDDIAHDDDISLSNIIRFFERHMLAIARSAQNH